MTLKKMTFVLISIISIALVTTYFTGEQDSSSVISTTNPQRATPNEEPDKLVLQENSLQQSEKVTGALIRVVDDQQVGVKKFALIITKTPKEIKGSCDWFETSSFSLPNFLKDEWCATFYSIKHVPVVISVGELRKKGTVILPRSPIISGSAYYNGDRLPSGKAVLKFSGDHVSTLMIKLHATKLNKNIHYRDGSIVLESNVHNGRFRFSNLLKLGYCQIEIFSKRAKSAKRTLSLKIPNETKNIRFDLEATATLKGRFIQNGEGLGNIGIDVYDSPVETGEMRRSHIITSSRTDPSGYFEIANMPTKRLKLFFQMSAKHKALAHTHYVDVIDPIVYDLGDIESPNIALKGQVKDRLGNPISGVRVFGGGSNSDFEKIPHFECLTDENGKVEVILPQWKNIEIQLDPKTLPNNYYCPRNRDYQRLKGHCRSFEFIVEQSPPSFHLLVPNHINANTLYIFKENGLVGMGGYNFDSKSKMKLFELKKLDPGTYDIYFSSAKNRTENGDWWKIELIVDSHSTKSVIKIEIGEKHSIKTVHYTFDIVGGRPQYLFVNPIKMSNGFTTNIITLPVSDNQASLQIPAGFPIFLDAAPYKINGKNQYKPPARGGFYQLNLSKKNP